MKYVYVPHILHSNKKNKDYYCVSIDLIDEKGNTIKQGEPIIWLTEDKYKNLLNIQK